MRSKGVHLSRRGMWVFPIRQSFRGEYRQTPGWRKEKNVWPSGQYISGYVCVTIFRHEIPSAHSFVLRLGNGSERCGYVVRFTNVLGVFVCSIVFSHWGLGLSGKEGVSERTESRGSARLMPLFTHSSIVQAHEDMTGTWDRSVTGVGGAALFSMPSGRAGGPHVVCS